MSGLSEQEWNDILATLPASPEAALGWELSLVRRTVERILAARTEQARPGPQGQAMIPASTRADWRADSRPTNHGSARVATLNRRIRQLLDALDAAEQARPEHVDLFPAESLALSVAVAQVRRGEAPEPNVATMCTLALARLAGRYDWTTEGEPADRADALEAKP